MRQTAASNASDSGAPAIRIEPHLPLIAQLGAQGRTDRQVAPEAIDALKESGFAVHAFQLAIMDHQALDEVYADDPNTLISSSYNPVGAVVEARDGGFMLSGRWGWSSGSGHCSWVLLGGVVPGDDYRTFLVPRSAPGASLSRREQ